MTEQNTLIEPRKSRVGLRLPAAILLAFIVVLSAGATNVAVTSRPGPALVSEGLDANGQIQLLANKSAVLTTARPIKRVNVGQPDIADVNVLGPTSLLITAKKGGSTHLIVWDENERSQVIDVTVSIDLALLQQNLKLLLPTARIETANVSGSIALRGHVGSAVVAEQAVKIAEPFGKVLNFLEISGGQQVMLQVRFAEVSRSAVSQLGINGSFVDGAFLGGSNIGQVNPVSAFSRGQVGVVPPSAGLPALNRDINSSVTLFGSGQIGSFYLDMFINALRQNNLLRILAEPNLVAISGQEASFLAGGEFPIPVTQGGSGGAGAAVTVEFREFGIKLAFVPVVLGDGRIRLKVAPEVSDLDFTTAVRLGGFVVPGLSQRKVNTTIEMTEGQTFAIAGLLSSSVTATKDVTPGLGDIPVLGALFRSVRYQRKETELLVLVTPRLVEPMNPAQVSDAPGERWRHPNENELFFRQDVGGPLGDARRLPATTQPAATGTPPRFYGTYGFVQVTTEPGK